MFILKNRRFRKGRLYGINTVQSMGFLHRGSFGLKVLENGYLTLEQLEAARKAIKMSVHRFRFVDPLCIRVTPLLSRSKKKKGIRMGGAKGGFYRYVYRARKGSILCEIHGILRYQIIQKLKRLVSKFPVRVAIIIFRC